MVTMRQLPYLNGIKAFEATARGGSFTAAAGELSVTPAAVSRMVHLLEQRLGVDLFERSANRLSLTAAGKSYQIGLTPILDALALLTDQVTAQSATRALTIGVGPTFAIRWLIPGSHPSANLPQILTFGSRPAGPLRPLPTTGRAA